MGRGRAIVCLIALGALVGGCAETRLAVHTAKRIERATGEQPAPQYKVGTPYRIDGVYYYPEVDYRYAETGVASWYGRKFHGRKTANGEIFDMNALTAAHRTLPLPSVVRVVNLENGRSLVVRVNDRGPFAHGRIIDLSRRAAQLLGFQRNGIARVRVEIMPEESQRVAWLASGGAAGRAAGNRTKTRPPVKIRPVAARTTAPAAKSGPTAGLYVQAGAFLSYSNADQARIRLSRYGRASVHLAHIGRDRFYRVRVGPLPSAEEGERLLARIFASGYPRARLVIE